MKKAVIYSLVCLALAACSGMEKQVSPNERIGLEYIGDGVKTHAFKITYSGQEGITEVMDIPTIGILTDSTSISTWELKETVKGKYMETNYTMKAGKRETCSNQWNEYRYVFSDSLKQQMDLVFRLYNDGIAFRYELPHTDGTRIVDETTTYTIPEGKKRWIQPYDPGYEGFYPTSTTGKGRKQEWGYPALIQTDSDVWTLISEAGIERMHSASYLKNETDVEAYKITLGENAKTVSGHWCSPWRVLMIGSLANIVESTLITDVSPESRLEDTGWIEPGSVSWIYWAYNHGSKDYQIVKKYIDMAVELSLPYVLIDAEWDEMSNGGSIEDAIKYAKECGVKPMIWYNSSTAWIKDWGAPGPHERLNNPVNRDKEFQWLEDMGVAGVKIDFFAGDKQETMEYYIDLMECAMKHKLMVNFHGATIPRGWQRTYPNLMTMEAVYGAEWYNNAPILTNRAAAHNATLPFTRNVIGPMDYTPCTFSDSQHPHITTHAHELALTVLYESALQHLADRPESYLAQPEEVKQFLTLLPTAWNDTKLVTGYPADHVVMARQKGNKWYVAALNGKETSQNISVDWSFLNEGTYQITTFADSDNKEEPWNINKQTVTRSELMQSIELLPRGGFVAVIEK